MLFDGDVSRRNLEKLQKVLGRMSEPDSPARCQSFVRALSSGAVNVSLPRRTVCQVSALKLAVGTLAIDRPFGYALGCGMAECGLVAQLVRAHA
jgi:hypothetical protein